MHSAIPSPFATPALPWALPKINPGWKILRWALALVLSTLLLLPLDKAAGAATVYSTSLRVHAKVEGGNAIRLNWFLYDSPTITGFLVRRKLPADSTWTTTLVPLSANSKTTTYLDTTAVPGVLYEYHVQLSASASPDDNGAWGIVCAGIAVNPMHQRGRVILVVDATMVTPLAADIDRFKRDLIGDGWLVTTISSPRHVAYPTTANSMTDATNPAAILKVAIRSVYNADPTNTKAVILLGHVQVPYTGYSNYDGHGSRAFPCDVYYGNMTGTWTDTTTNRTDWDGTRNDNVPGDGKFDTNLITGTDPHKPCNELYVGRIDTSSLTSFGSESALLRRYLEKDYKWRHNLMPVERKVAYYEEHDIDIFSHGNPTLRRGLPSVYTDAQIISSSATRSPPGSTYVPAVETSAYEWLSVGSSGAASGIGGLDMTTLAYRDVQAIFFGLYGSYIGDYDQADDLLRSVVAAPRYGLAAYLGGENAHYVSRMAMGRPFGEGQIPRLNGGIPTTNNDFIATYGDATNSYSRQGNVFYTIQGDPTLCLAPLSAPRSPQFDGTTFSWSAPANAVDGYFVYSAPTINDSFTLLTPTAITATSFAVPSGSPAGTIYMVRAVQLTSPYSGSYYALSQGVYSDANSNVAPMVSIGPDVHVYDTSTVALNAVVTDDGFPSGQLSGQWSMAEGPGTVTFADATAQSTTATFSTGGHYRLVYTASDGSLSSSDTAYFDVSADVLYPTDNAYGEPSNPTGTYSGNFFDELIAGGGRRIFLKFDLGVRFRRPTSTVLRLRTYGSGIAAGHWNVYAVADTTWTEAALTFANQPAIITPMITSSRDIAATETNTWIDIDLGHFLDGKTGKFTVCLTSASASLPAYARWGYSAVYAPQLVLGYNPATPQQGLYWQESFTLPDNTIVDTGTTAWSLDRTAALPSSSFIFAVRSNALMLQYPRAEVSWSSEVIPLNPLKTYAISFRLDKFGTLETADYARAYYKLNGGPETLFSDYTSEFTGPVGASVAQLQGSTLQIVFRAKTDATDEGYLWDDVRVFSLDGTPSPLVYNQWTHDNGLPSDATGLAAPTASAAGDGIQNVMKFALGINPQVFGYQNQLQLGTIDASGKTYLSLTYTRPEPAPPGISYTVETSDTVGGWTSVDTVPTSDTTTGGKRTISIRDAYSTTDRPKRFIRLRVDQP